VALKLFVLLFCATVAFLLGKGYYESLRTGVLTIKGCTSRRDREPISYWIGMTLGAIAFLVMVSGTALVAFLLCMDLFGTSK
jgi:hypothetical protein